MNQRLESQKLKMLSDLESREKQMQQMAFEKKQARQIASIDKQKQTKLKIE